MTVQWWLLLSLSQKGMSAKKIILAKTMGKREGQVLTSPMAETSYYIWLNFVSRVISSSQREQPQTCWTNQEEGSLQRRKRKMSIPFGKPAVKRTGLGYRHSSNFTLKSVGPPSSGLCPCLQHLFAHLLDPWFMPDPAPNSATPLPHKWSSLWLCLHITLRLQYLLLSYTCHSAIAKYLNLCHFTV